MAGITDFFKTHIWTTLFAAITSSGLLTGSVSYYFALQQARTERFENSLMAEYQAIGASKRELFVAVDKFTAALATGAAPDGQVVAQMNEKLLDLHQRVDIFNIGLSADEIKILRELQTSLANMKLEVARSKSKEDLPYFAGSVAQFEAAYQAARPIVERKIGLPTEPMTG